MLIKIVLDVAPKIIIMAKTHFDYLVRLKHYLCFNVSGPDENEITDVPSLAGYLQLTKLDWQYKTEPTPYACLGFKNRRCSWPRGKVIKKIF